MRHIFFFVLLALIKMATLPTMASATNEPVIPGFWDPQERFIKPNVKALPRLRFLTTTDFPPFSFIDSSNRLTGFHIDLARAVCKELELLPVCQIQAVPFSELETELNSGSGDAIMAGTVVSAQSRARLGFTRPYFQLPARFVAKKASSIAEPLAESLAGKVVGVIDGTAHAAMARATFGEIQLRLFENQDAALSALQKDQVSAVFADGLSLAFWMQDEKQTCCEFIGGPYLSQSYFGIGLSIAVKKDNRELEDALNYALKAVDENGTFEELYLRYFPISLF